jgi:hypothetical protein
MQTLLIMAIFQVPNPSAANDEGITALHNSICAGHFDIVKYLVENGCDVNAQDSDGWYVTLHLVFYYKSFSFCIISNKNYFQTNKSTSVSLALQLLSYINER